MKMLSLRAQAFSMENLLRPTASNECLALDLTSPNAPSSNRHQESINHAAKTTKTTLSVPLAQSIEHLDGQSEPTQKFLQHSLFREDTNLNRRRRLSCEGRNSETGTDVKHPRVCWSAHAKLATNKENNNVSETERPECGQSHETKSTENSGSISDSELEVQPSRDPSQETVPILPPTSKSQIYESSIHDINNNSFNNKAILFPENGGVFTYHRQFLKPLIEKNKKQREDRGLDLKTKTQYCADVPYRQLQREILESVFCFNHGDVSCLGHPGIVSVQDCNNVGRELLVELIHADLWSSFHCLGTEMIITKSGRRMFPAFKVRFSGLDPNKMYTVKLDFLQPDSRKYRYIYHSSQWVVSGSGDSLEEAPSYVTQDGPISGKDICYQVVSFERLKLTNVESSRPGQVSLVSMQKFQPRVVVEEHAPSSSSKGERFEIIFPQTSFIAVTAYQNQQITTLKIASNPFAKGFRDSGKSRPLLYPPTTPFSLPPSWNCLSGVPGIFSSDQKGPTTKEPFRLDIGTLEHLYKLKKLHQLQSPLLNPKEDRALNIKEKAYDYSKSNIHNTTLPSASDMATFFSLSFKQQEIHQSATYRQHQDYINYDNQTRQLLQHQQMTGNSLIVPGANTCNSQFNAGSTLHLQDPAVGNSAIEPPAFFGSAFRLPPIFCALPSHLYSQDGTNSSCVFDSAHSALPLLPSQNQTCHSISLLSSPAEAIHNGRMCESQRVDMSQDDERHNRSLTSPTRPDGSQKVLAQRDSPSLSSIVSSNSSEQSPYPSNNSPVQL